MNYFKGLFILPLIYISTCSATVKGSSSDDFKKIITCVSDGNTSCLNDIPDKIHDLNFVESIMLRDAFAHSLLISPSLTLDTLNRIDRDVAKTGDSFIRDNYGADIVCSYMIDSNKYDRESFFKYYSIVKSNLKKTGSKGKSCLDLMNASVEEINYEERMDKMKWGDKKYPF